MSKTKTTRFSALARIPARVDAVTARDGVLGARRGELIALVGPIATGEISVIARWRGVIEADTDRFSVLRAMARRQPARSS